MMWEIFEPIILTIITVYLVGALIGGTMSLWQLNFTKKKIVDNNERMVHDIGISFMWTFVWPYCLTHWIHHKLEQDFMGEE